MAFMGIKVPGNKWNEFLSLPIPIGEPLAPEEYHITLFYMESGDPIEMSRAVLGCHHLMKKWNPFMVHAALLTTFKGDPEHGVPVVVRVVSEELMKFRDELKGVLDSLKVNYSNKYPEFKPHVTLTYGIERIQPKIIKPISWQVDNIWAWYGKEMDDKIVTQIMFK